MSERTNYYHNPKRDFESVVKNPKKVNLESSEDLSYLNDRFTQTLPDWKRLTSEYHHIKHDIDIVRSIRGKYEKKFSDRELFSLFSEMHLRDYLEDNGHIQNEIIPTGARTQNYLFERSLDGRLHVYNRSRTKELYEYDALASYDNLPVLYEVKMSNNCVNGVNEYIENAMSRSRVEDIFKPFVEYFGIKKFGYSLVIPPEEARADSLTQKRFLNEGGLISPFCMKNSLYQRAVYDVRQEYRM